MDYTTCFVTTMDANLIGVEFDYSGNNKQWTLTIGFKRTIKGHSDIKFTVLRNDEQVAIKEVEMTEVESFVKIPFTARDGDNINYEVMNRTDTTDMVITHISMSAQ